MAKGVRMRNAVFAAAIFGVAGLTNGQRIAERPVVGTSPLLLRVGAADPSGLPNLLSEPPSAFRPKQRYVMQIAGPMTREWRAALEGAGIQVGPYLPKHAYIVELAGIAPNAIGSLPFVKWLGEYSNAWKLDPGIGQRLMPFRSPERIELADQGRLVLIVTLFPGEGLPAIRVDLMGLGAAILQTASVGDNDVAAISIDGKNLNALAAFPDVQFVEEAGEVALRNSTTRWIVQSNVANLTPLYDNGITGVGQVVGIMDGRIHVAHCSFFDSEPVGPLHRKVLAYNAGPGSDGHGTHVAGTAVGDAGSNTDTRGIAYGGRLVFADVPSFSEVAMNNALTLHHNQGARVHTNSWGDDGTTAYNGLARGIDVFSYNNEEDLVLFAVTNTATLKNPENAKNLLAVGASSDTPNQANHCFGGTGPTIDGRRKPEVYAPGCNTQSSSVSPCGTVSSSGTSMATPAVAGAAMLVWQYYMNGYYPSGFPTPAHAFVPSGALVKATLINSAVDMTGVTGYPSNREGWGRILIGDTLHFPGDVRRFVVAADERNAVGIASHETWSYSIAVLAGASPLKATLVWTDPPATSGSFFASINDLDLEVVSPDDDHYLGNQFSGGFSVTGGTKDPRNNVEQVHVPIPTPGVWMFHVVGADVPVGLQGFALVISGAEPDPTCTDDIQNQGEDRIDCGGPCPACFCVTDETCADAQFCNGVEICDVFGECGAGSAACPSPAFPYCNELEDRCDECASVADCDDRIDCTADECITPANACGHTPLTILYGDLDGSGMVELADLLCVLAAYELEDSCSGADIFPCMPDGTVELGDLLAILGAYEGLPPCPDPCPPPG